MNKLVILALFIFVSFKSYAFLPVAKVVNVKGKVIVNDQLLKKDSEIAEGYKIRLKRNEKLTVVFQNGHQVVLKGAHLTVETLNPKNALLNLERGSVYLNILPMTTNETFHVRSKNILVAASGSQFVMDNNGKQIRLAVGKGSIGVQRLKETLELNKFEEMVLNDSPKFVKTKIDENKFSKVMKSF